MYFVYALVDPLNNQPFYIGKGSGNRPRHHLYETVTNTSNRKKYNKIQKIKTKKLKPIVVIIHDNLSECQAFELERTLILRFGRKDIDPDGTLLNIHEGGSQPIGNDNFTTNNPSTKYKGVLYEERYGVERAAEIKVRRSQSLQGRQFSTYSRNRMSVAARKRDHTYKNKQVRTPDGVFDSVQHLMKFYNISRPTATKRLQQLDDWGYC